MPIALEAYIPAGLLTGSVVADGRLIDLLAGFTSVVVQHASVAPLDGAPQRTDDWSTVAVDDLLIVVAAPGTVLAHHAVWHPIVIDAGPYRIRGELPALPGFDPARALARPTGSFVLLGQAAVELQSEGAIWGRNDHAFVWVNRYAVERVESDLELGFFFPGARETLTGQTPPAAHRESMLHGTA